jgi:uncharacterized protein YdeI (YjbR/CyaY-like superfamily)
MEIGKTLYVKNRREWRAWLSKNHKTRREIWLIYFRKASGRSRVSYNDAVEEALCFGWIDSLAKPIDKERWAQRFSPRRSKSQLSPMNRERVARLIASGRMTRGGLEAIADQLKKAAATSKRGHVVIPADILSRLKRDPIVWRNFSRFPASYKRIRIGWIEGARKRPQVVETRLRYFIKMTKANKRFGMVQ